MKDGGWSLGEKGWELHPSQVERVRREWAATSARIDAATEHYPKCELCGQRCIRLDAAGLCSKVTPSHVADRAEWKAAQGGVRFR